MSFIADTLHIIANISWTTDIMATIVALAVGIIWYHPDVFGTVWEELSYPNEKDDVTHVREYKKLIWIAPIMFLVVANIAAFCKHFGYTTVEKGFLMGYDLGLITCMFVGMRYILEEKPLKLYAINAGYTLLVSSLIGIIIGATL